MNLRQVNNSSFILVVVANKIKFFIRHFYDNVEIASFKFKILEKNI